MTVGYNLDISSSTTWNFLKIIFRWRGSIWKSVAGEFVAWTICYFAISIVYRYYLDKDQQAYFEKVADYMDDNLGYIPLTFLLGFFVSIIFGRWKDIFMHMGFVDRAAFFVANYINGDEEEFKIIKRNILRYLCLTQVMVLRDISIQIRKRFPKMQCVVEAGFIMPHELKIMESIHIEFPKYWMPIHWACALAVQCKKRGKIAADAMLNAMIVEIGAYEEHLRTLMSYDWVPLPLAYPQVVFLAVRVYFLLTLISRQYIINEESPRYSKVDMIVPFMSMLQLGFQMSWLKVAEALLNPFGEDDDDFECNYLIDRNITLAMTMLDQVDNLPEQLKDNFKLDQKPLYSEESVKTGIRALMGSACKADVVEDHVEVKMVPRDSFDASSTTSRDRSQSINLAQLAEDLITRRPSKDLNLNRSFSMSYGSGHPYNPSFPFPPWQNHRVAPTEHLEQIVEEKTSPKEV